MVDKSVIRRWLIEGVTAGATHVILLAADNMVGCVPLQVLPTQELLTVLKECVTTDKVKILGVFNLAKSIDDLMNDVDLNAVETPLKSTVAVRSYESLIGRVVNIVKCVNGKMVMVRGVVDSVIGSRGTCLVVDETGDGIRDTSSDCYNIWKSDDSDEDEGTDEESSTSDTETEPTDSDEEDDDSNSLILNDEDTDYVIVDVEDNNVILFEVATLDRRKRHRVSSDGNSIS